MDLLEGRKRLPSTAPGVNFINILLATLMLVDPERVKKIENLTIFFMLLGSASVKAVCRRLMKLCPGFNQTK